MFNLFSKSIWKDYKSMFFHYINSKKIQSYFDDANNIPFGFAQILVPSLFFNNVELEVDWEC